MKPAREKIALVTGASGYLASWLVKYLLEEGWTVHGTVRDLSNKEKTLHLGELGENSPGRLQLFEADLLKPGSFQEAMETCSVVFHTASPFLVGKTKDVENRLIRPAVEGTKNVLNTVNQTGSVNRVVLTSSVAAMYADASDMAKTDNNIFTEQDWNTSANLSYQAYSYSKTQAEKAAWEVAKEQARWDLLVINPSFILGPSLTMRNDSASIDFMIKLGNGTYKIGMPEMWLGIVDVRDVAQAHIAAAIRAEASGRHIVCAKSMSMLGVGKLLRDHFGDPFPFPKNKQPKWLVWLIGPLFGLDRKYIQRHIGHTLAFDHSYSIADLGMKYRPVETTLRDHFQQLLDDGLVKKR